MRAFNSFCGLRRFAALNPHLARNTIALREDSAQSVIEMTIKEPIYSQIGPKSLGFQYLSLQSNQRKFNQLHLIKPIVNMCEVGIKHVLSPGAPIRAIWLVRCLTPLWRPLPRDWSFVRRLLLSGIVWSSLASLPHLKTLRRKCGALSNAAKPFSR